MSTEGSENPGGDPPPPSPPLRGAAIRGARLALIGWGSSQALIFVGYLVLARLVDPSDFGRFAAASLIIGVGGLFAESGMMAALINRRDRIEEAASTAFFSLLLGGTLLTLMSLAASPLLGLFFRSGRVTALSAALSGWLLLRALTVVPDALLQRHMSYARRVAVDPLGAIAFTGTSIAVCSGGAGAWGLVAGTYASMLVQLVTAWLFLGERPRRSLASVAMWRELGGYARPVIGSEILRRIAGQLDVVMLGRFHSAASLGQYRNGVRLAQQPTNAFVDVGAYVLLPTLARLQGEPARLQASARRVFETSLTGSIPVSLAMIPLGVPIALLCLGDRWREAGLAIAGFSGVLIGVSLNSIASEILKAVGLPGRLMRIHGFGLVVTAVLVCAAAIPFGVLGVAIAISVSQLVIGLFAFSLVSPLIEMSGRALAAAAVRPLLAGALMLTAMVSFALLERPATRGQASGLALIVAEVLLGLLTYVSALAAIDPAWRRALMFAVARGARRIRPGIQTADRSG